MWVNNNVARRSPFFSPGQAVQRCFAVAKSGCALLLGWSSDALCKPWPNDTTSCCRGKRWLPTYRWNKYDFFYGSKVTIFLWLFCENRGRMLQIVPFFCSFFLYLLQMRFLLCNIFCAFLLFYPLFADMFCTSFAKMCVNILFFDIYAVVSIQYACVRVENALVCFFWTLSLQISDVLFLCVLGSFQGSFLCVLGA